MSSDDEEENTAGQGHQFSSGLHQQPTGTAAQRAPRHQAASGDETGAPSSLKATTLSLS